MTFTFEEKGHKYFLDGKPLTGVTTVLQVIAKPQLIQWAANEAVKYIKERVGTEENIGPSLWTKPVLIEDWEKLLEEARLAHRKKKEEAGSKGTDVHGTIEALIKEAIENNRGFVFNLSVENPQLQNFVRWASENKVKFLASEKRVYSETYWIGGTLDFLAEINGKKYVGDIKTSNKIYGREFFAQAAAYRLMLEEMGENGFEGSVVVRLGKDGSFEEVYSYDYENDKKLFLACLEVYRTIGSFTLEPLVK